MPMTPKNHSNEKYQNKSLRWVWPVGRSYCAAVGAAGPVGGVVPGGVVGWGSAAPHGWWRHGSSVPSVVGRPLVGPGHLLRRWRHEHTLLLLLKKALLFVSTSFFTWQWTWGSKVASTTSSVYALSLLYFMWKPRIYVHSCICFAWENMTEKCSVLLQVKICRRRQQ